MKLGTNIYFEVSEINLRCILRLSPEISPASWFPGLFEDFWDYFQNLTFKIGETRYKCIFWGLWDKFEVLPKIKPLPADFRGYMGWFFLFKLILLLTLCFCTPRIRSTDANAKVLYFQNFVILGHYNLIIFSKKMFKDFLR